MPSSNAEILIHPVRLRIIRALVTNPATPKEIAEELTDIPQSTLYRHINLLLEHDFIRVKETNQIRGVQEKVYELTSARSTLSKEELAQFTQQDHIRYFTLFMNTLLQDFNQYVEQSGSVDLEGDQASYFTSAVYASPQDIKDLKEQIIAFVESRKADLKPEQMQKYTLSVVVHPVLATQTKTQTKE